LKRIIFYKCLLDWVQIFTIRESLYGKNILPFAIDSQYQAGINGFTFDNYRAGSAFAHVTNLFGAGQLQVIAEDIEQAPSRFDFQRVFAPVYQKLQWHFPGRLYRLSGSTSSPFGYLFHPHPTAQIIRSYSMKPPIFSRIPDDENNNYYQADIIPELMSRFPFLFFQMEPR